MASEVPQVSGRGIPVAGNDIDTDRIIPARFLKAVTFDGLGAHAFADDRTQLQGQHPFDLPQYQGANVLVVNANFGCGSSREHAPQSLAKWGVRAIVGESFSEIFFGNCVMMGLPCLTAAPADVQRLQKLVADDPTATVVVDLVADRVSVGDWSAPATLKPGARQQLIAGTWDACGQLVANREQIQATRDRLPYVAWA
jgi:3-isopropylmalate/(R)-2-methylmalate dehydratase small subunit